MSLSFGQFLVFLKLAELLCPLEPGRDSVQGATIGLKIYFVAVKNHVVEMFDEDSIKVTEDYTRAIINHKNSYTGLTYATDTAVIKVELVNKQDELSETTRGEGGFGSTDTDKSE